MLLLCAQNQSGAGCHIYQEQYNINNPQLPPLTSLILPESLTLVKSLHIILPTQTRTHPLWYSGDHLGTRKRAGVESNLMRTSDSDHRHPCKCRCGKGWGKAETTSGYALTLKGDTAVSNLCNKRSGIVCTLRLRLTRPSWIRRVLTIRYWPCFACDASTCLTSSI